MLDVNRVWCSSKFGRRVALDMFHGVQLKWVGVLVTVVVSIVYILSNVTRLAVHDSPVRDLLINQGLLPVPRFHSTPNDLVSIKKGLVAVHNSSVAIYGLAKDIDGHLPQVLDQLTTLGSFFRSSRFVIIDGNSKDGTFAHLKSWANEDPSRRQALSVEAPKLETSGRFAGNDMPREGRLAHARNLALNLLHIPTANPAPDFLIAVDLDVVGWSESGVLDSFGRSDWDVMCAQGVTFQGIYRDTYAFRTSDIQTNHHFGGQDHEDFGISDAQRVENRLIVQESKKNVQKLTASSNVVAATSCFGGLAIYKVTPALRSCKYEHRARPLLEQSASQEMLDCEHVHFHECLRRESGSQELRVRSNPHMKLWYGHTGWRELLVMLRKQWNKLSMSSDNLRGFHRAEEMPRVSSDA